MAQFSMTDADNYGVSNQGSFFQLKDDKDTARVRFLYEKAEDIPGYSVHVVEIDGKNKYVNCLRTYDEPVERCPLCAAGNKIKAKLFLKLYNETTGECQIWERGKTFYSVLSGLSSRYNPLYNEIIEIERNGKKGDMQTTYQPYPIENSPINLDDYDCPDPIGLNILDKSAEAMKTFIRTGDFGDGDSYEVAKERHESNTSDETVRRRSQRAF